MKKKMLFWTTKTSLINKISYIINKTKKITIKTTCKMQETSIKT